MPRLTVMTVNVRQPDQEDGINCWAQRRDLLVETMLERDPDLIGTQELFMLQAEYIQSRAPEYAWFGRGRFGDHEDKHVGIFYKTERWRLMSSGDVWLSETPETPGSSSWDIIRPRQLTWGVLEAADVGQLTLLNTHFPYRAVEQHARRRTALLLKERVSAIPDSMPVIVTADFNSQAGGEIHDMLCEGLRDAWCTATSQIGPAGTLNSFGKLTTQRRVDWILYRAQWRVVEVETMARTRDGRYPSDHYPVVATFDVA